MSVRFCCHSKKIFKNQNQFFRFTRFIKHNNNFYNNCGRLLSTSSTSSTSSTTTSQQQPHTTKNPAVDLLKNEKIDFVDAFPSASADVAEGAFRREKIRLAYGFPTDNKWNVTRTQIVVNEQNQVDANQLVDILVADGANLRSVMEIRYLHVHDDGFTKLPDSGMVNIDDCLKEGKIELQFMPRVAPKVLGPAFSLDPNLGLILDHLNPIIRARFLAAGRPVSRVYRAAISCFGPRLDLSFRFQTVFMYRPPFSKLYRHERIELGRGIDICWGLNLTYVNFKHGSGGLLMIGVPVGLSIGGSFIKGGWLVPLLHPENDPPAPWQREAEALRRKKSDAVNVTVDNNNDVDEKK